MGGGFFSGDDEECRFFDAQEDIGSIGDANSDGDDEGVSIGFDYDLWIRSPKSVRERRGKFMKRMGLSIDGITVLENSSDVCSSVEQEEVVIDRVVKDGSFEEEFSSMSCSDENNLPCQNGNLANVDDEKISDGRDLGSDQLVVAKEHEDSENNASGVSPLVGREFEEKDDADGVTRRRMKRLRRGWFRRLRSMTCMIDRQGGEGCDDNGKQEGGICAAISGCRLQKVKVRQCRKQTKELSALYLRQDIQAHEGSILTMKFSPDGQYLASGGEDGVVRLWQVVEEDRRNEVDISEIDPSCIYFTVDNLSQLTPLFMDKEKLGKLKSLRKTSDSACVVFPPKIFRLLEKPLREFRGHKSEVLDLSWSKNNVSEMSLIQ